MGGCDENSAHKCVYSGHTLLYGILAHKLFGFLHMRQYSSPTFLPRSPHQVPRPMPINSSPTFLPRSPTFLPRSLAPASGLHDPHPLRNDSYPPSRRPSRFDLAFLRQLTHWFKHQFFTWPASTPNSHFRGGIVSQFRGRVLLLPAAGIRFCLCSLRRGSRVSLLL